MWLGIIVVVIAIGIGVLIGSKQAKANKQLINEGKMIQRDYRFAEKGEEFTAKVGTMGDVADKLKNMYLPCPMKGNTSTQVNFTGEKFTARLYRVDYDEPSGIAIYRFEFTSWKTYRGRYEQNNAMNILMTSIEKAFLELDPNTAVKSYDIDFKTKHSIF